MVMKGSRVAGGREEKADRGGITQAGTAERGPRARRQAVGAEPRPAPESRRHVQRAPQQPGPVPPLQRLPHAALAADPAPARPARHRLRRHQPGVCVPLLAGAAPARSPGAATSPLGRFEDCVFFSVQTLATIGYGKLVPNTRAANMLVAIEALVGLLGFAIVSGLLFARFTRPTARISFSRNAVIAPYEDGWALMFRLANLRNHNLTDVHAVVSFARWIDENGRRRRRFDQLALERDAIIFMPLHWVVVHPITDASPLRGLTPETLAGAEPEVVCLISAADETFAQIVHAKTSYDKSDIVVGRPLSRHVRERCRPGRDRSRPPPRHRAGAAAEFALTRAGTRDGGRGIGGRGEGSEDGERDRRTGRGIGGRGEGSEGGERDRRAGRGIGGRGEGSEDGERDRRTGRGIGGRGEGSEDGERDRRAGRGIGGRGEGSEGGERDRRTGGGIGIRGQGSGIRDQGSGEGRGNDIGTQGRALCPPAARQPARPLSSASAPRSSPRCTRATSGSPRCGPTGAAAACRGCPASPRTSP